MDHVISEACYTNTVFLQRNYRKMTIKWSFSYNSFVFYDKKVREPQHDCVKSESLYKQGAFRVCTGLKIT